MSCGWGGRGAAPSGPWEERAETFVGTLVMGTEQSPEDVLKCMFLFIFLSSF